MENMNQIYSLFYYLSFTFGILFLFSYFYILNKIGVKYFKYNEFYKIIFPIYIFINISKDKNFKNIILSILNLIFLILWAYISFRR